MMFNILGKDKGNLDDVGWKDVFSSFVPEHYNSLKVPSRSDLPVEWVYTILPQVWDRIPVCLLNFVTVPHLYM